MSTPYALLLLVCCLHISGGCGPQQTASNNSAEPTLNESDRGNVRIAEGLQELSQIQYSVEGPETEREKVREENGRRIDKVLEKYENPTDLASIALVCRNVAKRCTSAECIKTSRTLPTFQNTYWKVVGRLAANKQANSSVLADLKSRSQLTGTDLGDWDRIVDGKPFP